MFRKNSNSGRSSGGFSRGSNKFGGPRPAFKGGFRNGPKAASAGNRGRSFGGPRGGFRPAKKRFEGARIDVSKFINRAVITEEVEKFVPEHKFSDFHIDERLKRSIAGRGYETPTPIQDKSIPHILRGADVVGIANTGTGKTGAFLIPSINKIIKNSQENVIIVVPTRELAIQIDEEFKAFRIKGIYSACCVGGAPMGKQIIQLRHRNNVIIGTPGRLKDFIERKLIDLSKFNTIVLDEADRMLDMGFIHDMKYMMAKMPKERQTLFFSATLSPEIDRLIKDFLEEPVRISVKTQDTAKNIDQDVVRVERGTDKVDALQTLLKETGFHKVLIFGRTKHGVERLSVTLNKRGFKAASIHGDKTQSHRQKALGQFRNNEIQALVATDVAARGLDIPGVTHVINFDLPATYDDYIHRIGRTGRGNAKGKALTIID